MKLDTLVDILDREFMTTDENLTGWAVTAENRSLINPDFLRRTTALLIKGSPTVDKVFTAVFLSDHVMETMSRQKNALLFSHHGLNFYEDERGLETVSYEAFRGLKDAGVSVYVSHASLDTHPAYGTSLSLAKTLEIKPCKLFYEYYGIPIAVMGSVDRVGIDTFAGIMREKIGRPFVTLVKNRGYVEKIAVAAGAGDNPEILREAYRNGCDTFITGTVENRWAVEGFQYLNRKFHQLNSELKLNLIGGTHYATERPAMLYLADYFRSIGLDAEFCEDPSLLNAL